MATWLFTTPTVAEAPFAWNPLHERFKINRAISIKEVEPGVWVEVRYDAYTNELGATNIPAGTYDPNPRPSLGLRYYRGGYEWIVDDATKASLIASGLVTEANFGPAPQTFGEGGFGEGGFGL